MEGWRRVPHSIVDSCRTPGTCQCHVGCCVRHGFIVGIQSFTKIELPPQAALISQSGTMLVNVLQRICFFGIVGGLDIITFCPVTKVAGHVNQTWLLEPRYGQLLICFT